VDATEETALAGRFDDSGYPTITVRRAAPGSCAPEARPPRACACAAPIAAGAASRQRVWAPLPLLRHARRSAAAVEAGAAPAEGSSRRRRGTASQRRNIVAADPGCCFMRTAF
jgi:hypothetical protein